MSRIFRDKITDSCSNHCGSTTRQFSEKSHLHEKQKIARVATALALKSTIVFAAYADQSISLLHIVFYNTDRVHVVV